MPVVNNFKKVEPQTKIIWDSGFGYEIGFFIRTSDDIMYNTVVVELITGRQTGNALRSADSIHLYSEESLQAMYQKYKYWHNFPEKEKVVTCGELN